MNVGKFSFSKERVSKSEGHCKRLRGKSFRPAMLHAAPDDNVKAAQFFCLSEELADKAERQRVRNQATV
jgi:hypothetical protein